MVYASLDELLRALGPTPERDAFVAAVARLAGSRPSLQYLRHVAAGRKRPAVEFCVAVEVASGNRIRCESLRPDVDWAYLASRRVADRQALAAPSRLGGAELGSSAASSEPAAGGVVEYKAYTDRCDVSIPSGGFSA